MTNKFELQDNQYKFPYHHISYFREDGTPIRMRFLRWGMDYLCYMKHIKDMVLELKPASILDVGCGDGYFLRSLDSLSAYKWGNLSFESGDLILLKLFILKKYTAVLMPHKSMNSSMLLRPLKY